MNNPLLFPVTLHKDSIRVLDETLLPAAERYIDVTSLADARSVLGQMKTRALGQVLLFFYSCVLFGQMHSIDDIVIQFTKIRPTFDFPMLGQIIKNIAKTNETLRPAICGFIKEFDAARRLRAQTIAERLQNKEHVLTICNVNGELLYLFEAARKMNKDIFFYVSETRPYLQGTRLTFWALRRNDIPCKLIADNQAAYLMQQRKISCVICGADRATMNGAIINKIGTYALGRLAHHFGLKMYALVQYPRDIDIDAIDIEERPSQEAFLYCGSTPDDIEALYPSFDVTPAECISETFSLTL